MQRGAFQNSDSDVGVSACKTVPLESDSRGRRMHPGAARGEDPAVPYVTMTDSGLGWRGRVARVVP